MPISTPAMQAAYRRAPSLDTARDIVLRELAARPRKELTIMQIVASSPEWFRARDTLDASPDPLVSRAQLLDAFQNRLGAAARLLAGTALRSGPVEAPKIRLVGRRKWALLGEAKPAEETAPPQQDPGLANLPPEAIDLHFQAPPPAGQPTPVEPGPILSGPGMPTMRGDDDPADPINRVLQAAADAGARASGKEAPDQLLARDVDLYIERALRGHPQAAELRALIGTGEIQSAADVDAIVRAFDRGILFGSGAEANNVGGEMFETADDQEPSLAETDHQGAQRKIGCAVTALAEALFSGRSTQDVLMLAALRENLKAMRLLGMNDGNIASIVSDGVVMGLMADPGPRLYAKQK